MAHTSTPRTGFLRSAVLLGLLGTVLTGWTTPAAATWPAAARQVADQPGAPPSQLLLPTVRAYDSPTTDFYYAQSAAYPTRRASGAAATMSAQQPFVLRPGTASEHSLGELAVLSADGRQIVEVGWTVDPRQFGDDLPHLFVFHWVDGEPTCYNGCGFVPSPAGEDELGMALTPGVEYHFMINHVTSGTGKWQINFGRAGTSHRLGHFPDSLWGSSAFTEVSLVQVFGEVANSVGTPPCYDEMGTGAFPTATSGATISDVYFLPTSHPPVDLLVEASHPDFYQIVKTGPTSARYGGPGAGPALPACAESPF